MNNPLASETLTLTKPDELSAIAAFINRTLNPRGITARVGWNHNCLGILLEARPVPDQEEMIAFIRQSLAAFPSDSIQVVKVCGYQPGQSLPAWYEEIELEAGAVPVPIGSDAPSLISWLNQGIAGLEPEAIDRDHVSLPLAQHSHAPSYQSVQTVPVVEVRFLRFYCTAQETALLPLSSIQQVLKVPVLEILPVPHMPDSVLGIYNWRGEMLWLVDLAQQLGFASPFVDFRGLETLTAIAIQAEHQFLGIVVPHIKDIETYSLHQLQPPTAAFPNKLLSFMKGYFSSSSSPVLDAKALIQDPLLQVHCPR